MTPTQQAGSFAGTAPAGQRELLAWGRGYLAGYASAAGEARDRIAAALAELDGRWRAHLDALDAEDAERLDAALRRVSRTVDAPSYSDLCARRGEPARAARARQREAALWAGWATGGPA